MQRKADVRTAGARWVIGALATAAALSLALAAQTAVASPVAERDNPSYMSPTPSKNVTVLVVIDDRGIAVHAFRQAGAGSGTSLETLTGPVPAGDLVTFNVYNRGKKLHNFTIFGKSTPTLKPGKTGRLYFAVKAPGRYLYRSTMDKTTAFKGYLTVG
jgi:plastocyanin